MDISTSTTRPGWRILLGQGVAVLAATLAACGGGGSADTPAAATTTPAAAVSASYAQGAITGFGSVVVGGVRYDDSSATVTDEDGNRADNSVFKLGMTVQVDASAVDRSTLRATAQRIRYGSELVGPMGAVSAAASTVVVLGQTVLVTADTLFDSSLTGGLSALQALTAGAVLEVHGILDQTTGVVTATRIEKEDRVTAYRLRGVVSALDTTAKTFKVGSELVNYAGVTTVPSTLANGQVVRALVNTTQVSGAWVATKLSNGVRTPSTTTDAHLEGTVSAWTSATVFEIGGVKVDASAASFPDGTAGVVLGARVEVSGSVTSGVLVATKVEIESRSGNGNSHGNGTRGLELHGSISSLDATAQTFVLRTVTVSYAGSVTYKDGTAADLAAGKPVEVYGVLSADRTKLQASRIEFKN